MSRAFGMSRVSPTLLVAFSQKAAQIPPASAFDITAEKNEFDPTAPYAYFDPNDPASVQAYLSTTWRVQVTSAGTPLTRRALPCAHLPPQSTGGHDEPQRNVWWEEHGPDRHGRGARRPPSHCPGRN